MPRTLLIAAYVLCARLSAADVLPAGVTLTVDDRPGTAGTQSWTIASPYQQGANRLEFLLPDAALPDSAPPNHADPGRRFPVVYCLPVNDGIQGSWGHPLEVARRHDLANRFQAIFVCPAYAVTPWYGDNPARPEMRQSSYLTEVVVPVVEARLPALAEARGRYLVGFSKSGHGALGIFLRHPERFAKVAVFETWFGLPDAAQWEGWGFSACYGTRESYDAWNPQRLIDERKQELARGPTRIVVLNGGPGARLGVEQLLAQLRDRAIPHALIADRSWGHAWGSGWLPLAVAALLADRDVPAAP
jgi:S-formylglutathione hydrolase FrmB